MDVSPSLFAEEFLVFGRLVRDRRQAAGLSMAELASMSGVTNRSISLCERGLLQRGPSLEMVIRLAYVLHIPLSDVTQPMLHRLARSS